MNAVKGYEKVLPEQPSSHESLQHSKKICLLLAACFLILVAVASFVVVGFLHRKNTQQDESVYNGVQCSDLIEVLCNKTLYFEVCNSSLRAYPGAQEANMSELGRIAVEVSRDVAEDVLQLTLDLNKTAGSYDPGSLPPLRDCVELLGYSIDALNDSLSAMEDPNWIQRSDDVKTWLSAALTYPVTCTDGFEDLDVSMPPCLKQKIEYLEQIESNALAIVNYIAGVGEKIGKAQRTPGMNRLLLSRGK